MCVSFAAGESSSSRVRVSSSAALPTNFSSAYPDRASAGSAINSAAVCPRYCDVSTLYGASNAVSDRTGAVLATVLSACTGRVAS